MSLNATLVFSKGPGPAVVYPYQVVATLPITPQTIAAQYSIPPSYLAQYGGSQAVVEFEQQYYSPSDLDMFLTAFGIPSVPITVVGPNDATNPGGEANLDIQAIMGVARNVSTTFWSIYANTSAEIDDILTWAYAMGNTTSPPLVNSLSYGMTETNVDQFLGAGYLNRSDAEFMKLALRGITILIADGDAGAGDLGGPPMSASDCSVLHADWPSQSPYVTAVGSTYLTPNALPFCYLPAEEGGASCIGQPIGEVSTSIDNGLFWTTGGGFSTFTSTAWYQANVVSAYLSSNASTSVLPPAGLFTPGGRAYPDAVAIGHNVEVVLGGSFLPLDGTSASAPIFAGVISLLNDVRLGAGKSPLGFLNPLLYQLAATNGDAFYDVVVGQNRCGVIDFSPQCCDAAYHAGIGWDAVSGLGSPNFAVLKELVLALP